MNANELYEMICKTYRNLDSIVVNMSEIAETAERADDKEVRNDLVAHLGKMFTHVDNMTNHVMAWIDRCPALEHRRDWFDMVANAAAEIATRAEQTQRMQDYLASL